MQNNDLPGNSEIFRVDSAPDDVSSRGIGGSCFSLDVGLRRPWAEAPTASGDFSAWQTAAWAKTPRCLFNAALASRLLQIEHGTIILDVCWLCSNSGEPNAPPPRFVSVSPRRSTLQVTCLLNLPLALCQSRFAVKLLGDKTPPKTVVLFLKTTSGFSHLQE